MRNDGIIVGYNIKKTVQGGIVRAREKLCRKEVAPLHFSFPSFCPFPPSRWWTYCSTAQAFFFFFAGDIYIFLRVDIDC